MISKAIVIFLIIGIFILYIGNVDTKLTQVDIKHISKHFDRNILTQKQTIASYDEQIDIIRDIQEKVLSLSV
tara:strand:+ start:125 stop:340 length:216 start_codon:yes stop_codon:yes gene_type:complete